MTRERRRAVWALVVGASVFLFVEAPTNLPTRSLHHVWDLGHIILFACATLLWVTRRKGAVASLGTEWLVVLVGTMVVGACVEGLQGLVGRFVSVVDLGRNAVGASLAVVFASPLRQGEQVGKRKTARVVVTLLALGFLAPLARAVFDEVAARLAFPLLADFESAIQLDRWESDGSLALERRTTWAGAGALRVELSPARYSGVRLAYFPGDWRAWDGLRLRVFNPGGTIQLHLEVHDAHYFERGGSYSERFNRVFTVHRGWNELQVPMADIAEGPRTRPTDLRRIRGVSLFAVDLTAARTIIIDHVELSGRNTGRSGESPRETTQRHRPGRPL